MQIVKFGAILTLGIMWIQICRLGPPDFYPPTPNCAEEILNKDTCQSGYREIIDGIEVNLCSQLGFVHSWFCTYAEKLEYCYVCEVDFTMGNSLEICFIIWDKEM